MANAKLVATISAILLLIGGLNWGFIGLFQIDVISSVFGEMTGFTRFVYVLVGLAGCYRVLVWLKKRK